MNIFKRSNKLIFACFLLVIAVLLGGAFINPSHADKLNNVIDSIDIKYSEGNDVINKGDIFSIYAEWSLKDGQAQPGDTFTVNLDNKLDTSLIKGSLTLVAEDGEIYAIGEIHGNKLTFTFTNAVKDKINIKGHFEIQGFKLDIENPEADKGIDETEIEIDGKGTTIKYNNGSYGNEKTETGSNGGNLDNNFEKHGSIYDNNSNPKNDDMYWTIYVNAKEYDGRTDKPIEISDKLEPGHSIVPSSFSLILRDDSNSNVDDSKNYVYNDGKPRDKFSEYVENLEIAEDGKSYSLTFYPGDSRKALIIYYHTKIDEDADPTQYIFENKVNITTGNEFETIIPEEVRYYKMLGTAQGENINKGSLEVMKVDEDGNPIKQNKATFRLKRNVEEEGKALNKSTEEFEPVIEKTNEEGIAIFQGLESGIYILEEISAPEGYQLSKETKKIGLNFKNENETIKTTFENKAVEKTEYRISKKWDIPEGINLDDLDDESLKVNFDLYKIRNKYDDSGKIIQNGLDADTDKIHVEGSTRSISLKDGDTDIVWSDLDAKDQYDNPIRYMAEESMDESIFELLIEGFIYNNPTFINKLKLEPLKPKDPEDPDKPEDPETPDKPEENEKPDPEDPVEPLIPEDPYEPGKPTDPDIPKDNPKENDPKESKDPENPIIPEDGEVSSHIDIDNENLNEIDIEDEDIEVGMLNDTVIDNDFETTSKNEKGPIDLLPQTGEKFRYPFYIIGLLFLALGLRVRKTK